MVATLVNGFEGTSAATISTSNSGGSDTQWSAVSNTIGTTTYDNAVSHNGSTAGKFQTTGLSGSPFAAWTSGVSATTVYIRFYFYVTALPSGNISLSQILSGTTVVASVRLTSAGKIVQLRNGTTVSATGTATMSTGTWYRIEQKVVAGTGTAGSVETRIYVGDSTTATETLTESSTSVGSAAAATIARFGLPVGLASTLVYIDDAAFSDINAFIGPTGPPTVAGAATLSEAGAISAAGSVRQAGSGTLSEGSTLTGTATAGLPPTDEITEPFTYSNGALATVATAHPWEVLAGGVTVVSGQVTTDDNVFGDAARCNRDLSSTDHYVEMTFNTLDLTGDRSMGISARYEPVANTCYYVELNEFNTRYNLLRFDSGSGTSLSGFTTISPWPGLPATMRLTCIGDQLTVSLNGTALGTFTDANLTTGTRVGIGGFNGGGLTRADNFHARIYTPFVAGTATLAEGSSATQAATLSIPAAGALSSASAGSFGASLLIPGSTTLTESSTVTPSGLVLVRGGVTLSEAPGLSSAASVLVRAAATLTEGSGLTSAASILVLAGVTLGEASALSAAGIPVVVGAATLTGATSLTSAASVLVLGAATLSTAPVLFCDANGVPIVQGTATLTGASAVSAVAYLLVGSGSVSMAATPGTTPDSRLTVYGLSTLAEVMGLASAGSLLITGAPQALIQPASLSAAGSALGTVGALLGEASNFVGLGSVLVRGQSALPAATALTGTGTLVLNAGTATFGVATTLTPTGHVITHGSAVLANGTFIGLGFDVIRGAVRISAHSHLIVTGRIAARYARPGWRYSGVSGILAPFEVGGESDLIIESNTTGRGDR